MPEGGTPKMCTGCGQDVHGTRRTRDRRGRYWCAPCYERAVAAQRGRAGRSPTTAATPPADPIDPHTVGRAARTLAPPPQPASRSDDAGLCPACRATMPPDAIVCLNCGYSRQTGRALHTVTRASSKAEAARDRIGDAARSGATSASFLTLSLLGALLGGLLGAGVWAAVALGFNVEISWIAILVGALAGLGARMGARAHVGVQSGALAAGVAILAVLGGKLATASLALDHLSRRPVDDALAIEIMAAAIQEEAGEEVFGMWLRRRGFAHSGPKMSWDDAMARATVVWHRELAEEDRRDALDTIRQDLEAMRRAGPAATRQGVLESLDLFDALFLIVALASAYGIGSGQSGNDEE